MITTDLRPDKRMVGEERSVGMAVSRMESDEVLVWEPGMDAASYESALQGQGGGSTNKRESRA